MSDPDEPDLWLRDFTGATRLWVEVGQPEEKPLLRACGKSVRVVVYAYQHAADIWWRGIEGKVARLRNLEVFRIPADASQQLAGLAQRSMQLQATVQEGALTISDERASVHLDPLRWK